MPEDAEEVEVVRGLLTFTIGGETRTVPELKWRDNRDWQDRLERTFRDLASVPADTPDGMRAMADAERALVLAYDRTGALGDLDDATEREVDAIYQGLVEVSFPLAQSPTAVMLTLVRLGAASASASSTNGPSRTGTSAAPTILKPRSRSGRSSSSTRKRKSA